MSSKKFAGMKHTIEDLIVYQNLNEMWIEANGRHPKTSHVSTSAYQDTALVEHVEEWMAKISPLRIKNDTPIVPFPTYE